MTESIDVAAAKSHFSDLLNRAAYSHERFLISKRGKPVAAIVSTADLAQLESGRAEPKGLLAAVGLFADVPEWEADMDVVIAARQRQQDRQVDMA